MQKPTPMMKQYRRIRGELPPGTLLFFRLGDFYEMFFEDAKVASKILDIALTKRNQVPMCGVPYHAADQYMAKLVRSGLKVAVCDQVEDASSANGIVRRDVTGIVTPGTITDDPAMASNRNNYLAGLCRAGDVFGLALLDLSTGSFHAERAEDAASLKENLRRFAPSECVVPAEQARDGTLAGVIERDGGIPVTESEDWTFERETARDVLVRHFAVHSLEGFGCEHEPAIAGAAGGVLYYVKEQLRRNVSHVRSLRVTSASRYLALDEATCSNLNLVTGPGRYGKSGGVEGSLLQVLDSTRTAMGGRLLREWLVRPLAEMEAIRDRHEAVEMFFRDRALLAEVRDVLGEVRDMERIIARLGSGGNARDLRALRVSLEKQPAVKSLLGGPAGRRVANVAAAIHALPDLCRRIDKAIADEPPITVREGGIIRKGYNADLDELRDAAGRGKQWLADFQAREKERTGIKNLKVRHNKVFGYYIEVSKGQLANVPPEYTRKQTLVNAERFVTPEMKEYEQRIFGAQDRSMALEYELFDEIRSLAVAETAKIQATAAALAELDVLSTFAERALACRYVRPIMVEGDDITIADGRHPVIEQMSDAERFVPNSVKVDCSENQVLIITGPNMAGKSTFIRQVALAVVMAQAGSFVPASDAELCIVDRLFTRVGASDDLARGRSTFMVEMQETANILNNATGESLIVLDEIGRGTSTFDGISIAWAVAEFLHNNNRVKAKTLFATHYHELTDLSLTLEGVKNYSILVREQGDRIVFLRKIVPGPADKSYGIQVAQLAGLPPEVVDRAKEILLNLEEGELSDQGKPKLARRRGRKGESDSRQMKLL